MTVLIEDSVIDAIRANQVIAYPTSTLPGLACLPNSEALDNLFTLKNRSADKPVSLGVANIEQARSLVEVPQVAIDLLNSFPRGVFTLILDAHEALDSRLGGERVAVRVLAREEAIRLCEILGPITATSANEAGETPEDNALDAGLGLGLDTSRIIPGECPGGSGSTILSIQRDENEQTGFSLTIMREGIIPREDVVLWWQKAN